LFLALLFQFFNIYRISLFWDNEGCIRRDALRFGKWVWKKNPKRKTIRNIIAVGEGQSFGTVYTATNGRGFGCDFTLDMTRF
jgi:hypothetical protein